MKKIDCKIIVSKRASKTCVSDETAKAIVEKLCQTTTSKQVFSLLPDQEIVHHCVVEGANGPIEILATVRLIDNQPCCFICTSAEKAEGNFD